MSERHVFKRDWIACLKYANHSRLKSQHDWGDLCDLQWAQESSHWQRIRYAYEIPKLWDKSLRRARLGFGNQLAPSCVLYPTRSECKEKWVQITHVYLIYIPHTHKSDALGAGGWAVDGVTNNRKWASMKWKKKKKNFCGDEIGLLQLYKTQYKWSKSRGWSNPSKTHSGTSDYSF